MTLEGHRDTITCLKFSANGRYLLSGSHDSTLRLWDIQEGTCAKVLLGHTNPIVCADLSKDGNWVLSGDSAGYIKIWDLSRETCVHMYETGSQRLRTLQFSYDDDRVLIATSEKAEIWQLVWDYEFSKPNSWKECVQSYLKTFVSAHTPYMEDDVFKRKGRPTWDQTDFNRLMSTMQLAGYGYLSPEDIEAALVRIANNWEIPLEFSKREFEGVPDPVFDLLQPIQSEWTPL